MNTAIVSSVIGTVGAGLIAVLIFYLQGLRDDIRTLGERLAKLEERLIRIETTQEAHGRILDGIADHGERISALEGAAAAMS